MTHYLRIEAVNIYTSLFDTNHISIIRGGSLLLKQAIDDIIKEFENFLIPISTGASVGLFQVIREDNPTDIKDRVIKFLNTENNYRYFTFVVADARSDNFKKAKEILIAKIRALQLQQNSISVDGKITNPVKPCTVDGIRKAYKLADFPDGKKALTNPFAKLKLVYGRRQRSKLYQNEFLELEKSLPGKTNVQDYKKTKFTQDLAALSHAPEFPSLNGKIAVIYFDGNGFSKIQAELVENEQDQIEFDLQVKNLRRLFLFSLIQHCSQGFGWLNEKKQLRLETLLWGGDEMLFVVPAWKGFELMNFFYKTSQEWEITLNEKSKPLTHAGGIVFCQHNSPIYKMRDLAQQLADRIKNHPDEQGRNANYYDYLVLESIDYPAEDLDSFFSHRYGDLATYRTYLSAHELAKTALQDFKNLREILPKSQVYAIALAARKLTITEDAVSKCLVIDNYSEFADSLIRLYQLAGSNEEKQQLKGTLAELELLLFPQTQYLLSEQPNHNMFLHDENSPLTEHIIQQALMWLNLVQCWDYLWTETIMPLPEEK